MAGSPQSSLAAPAGLDKGHLTALASVLREAVAGGTLPEVAVARLKTDLAKPAGRTVFTRRQVAKLLCNAHLPEYAGEFLPSSEQARTNADLEALNLLARHFLALHAKEAKAGNLEKAWAAVQAILAVPGGPPARRKKGCCGRSNSPRGSRTNSARHGWTRASPKTPPGGWRSSPPSERLVSRGLSTKPLATEERLNALKLTKTAVDALLKVAPDRAKEWRGTLTLLAAAWLREAEFSRQFDRSSGGGPRLRRDMYGNIFFGTTTRKIRWRA